MFSLSSSFLANLANCQGQNVEYSDEESIEDDVSDDGVARDDEVKQLPFKSIDVIDVKEEISICDDADAKNDLTRYNVIDVKEEVNNCDDADAKENVAKNDIIISENVPKTGILCTDCSDVISSADVDIKSTEKKSVRFADQLFEVIVEDEEPLIVQPVVPSEPQAAMSSEVVEQQQDSQGEDENYDEDFRMAIKNMIKKEIIRQMPKGKSGPLKPLSQSMMKKRSSSSSALLPSPHAESTFMSLSSSSLFKTSTKREQKPASCDECPQLPIECITELQSMSIDGSQHVTVPGTNHAGAGSTLRVEIQSSLRMDSTNRQKNANSTPRFHSRGIFSQNSDLTVDGFPTPLLSKKKNHSKALFQQLQHHDASNRAGEVFKDELSKIGVNSMRQFESQQRHRNLFYKYWHIQLVVAILDMDMNVVACLDHSSPGLDRYGGISLLTSVSQSITNTDHQHIPLLEIKFAELPSNIFCIVPLLLDDMGKDSSSHNHNASRNILSTGIIADVPPQKDVNASERINFGTCRIMQVDADFVPEYYSEYKEEESDEDDDHLSFTSRSRKSCDTVEDFDTILSPAGCAIPYVFYRSYVKPSAIFSNTKNDSMVSAQWNTKVVNHSVDTNEITELLPMVYNLLAFQNILPFSVIHFEHCRNCDKHEDHTRHVPLSYEAKCSSICSYVRAEIPHFLFFSNLKSVLQSYVKDPIPQFAELISPASDFPDLTPAPMLTAAKPTDPRLGSFELIYKPYARVRPNLLYSKLNVKSFPRQFDALLNSMKLLDNIALAESIDPKQSASLTLNRGHFQKPFILQILSMCSYRKTPNRDAVVSLFYLRNNAYSSPQLSLDDLVLLCPSLVAEVDHPSDVKVMNGTVLPVLPEATGATRTRKAPLTRQEIGKYILRKYPNAFLKTKMWGISQISQWFRGFNLSEWTITCITRFGVVDGPTFLYYTTVKNLNKWGIRNVVLVRKITSELALMLDAAPRPSSITRFDAGFSSNGMGMVLEDEAESLGTTHETLINTNRTYVVDPLIDRDPILQSTTNKFGATSYQIEQSGTYLFTVNSQNSEKYTSYPFYIDVANVSTCYSAITAPLCGKIIISIELLKDNSIRKSIPMADDCIAISVVNLSSKKRHVLRVTWPEADSSNSVNDDASCFVFAGWLPVGEYYSEVDGMVFSIPVPAIQRNIYSGGMCSDESEEIDDVELFYREMKALKCHRRLVMKAVNSMQRKFRSRRALLLADKIRFYMLVKIRLGGYIKTVIRLRIQNRKAVLMQKNIRRWLVRLRYIKAIRDIIRVQSIARGLAARRLRRRKVMFRRVTCIKANFRRKKTIQETFQLRVKSIQDRQRKARHRRALMLLFRVVLVHVHEKKRLAAARIQALVRQLQVRWRFIGILRIRQLIRPSFVRALVDRNTTAIYERKVAARELPQMMREEITTKMFFKCFEPARIQRERDQCKKRIESQLEQMELARLALELRQAWAAKTIQRVVRGHVARVYCARIIKFIVKLQSVVRARRLRKKVQFKFSNMRADGTTKIVSDTFLGRMFSTKSSFSIRRPVVQLTQEEAVCRIQRMTRIHRARQRYVFMYNERHGKMPPDIRRSQPSEEPNSRTGRFLSKFFSLKRLPFFGHKEDALAAKARDSRLINIHKYGEYRRNMLNMEMSAAVKIQSNFRGMFCRMSLAKRNILLSDELQHRYDGDYQAETLLELELLRKSAELAANAEPSPTVLDSLKESAAPYLHKMQVHGKILQNDVSEIMSQGATGAGQALSTAVSVTKSTTLNLVRQQMRMHERNSRRKNYVGGIQDALVTMHGQLIDKMPHIDCCWYIVIYPHLTKKYHDDVETDGYVHGDSDKNEAILPTALKDARRRHKEWHSRCSHELVRSKVSYPLSLSQIRNVVMGIHLTDLSRYDFLEIVLLMEHNGHDDYVISGPPKALSPKQMYDDDFENHELKALDKTPINFALSELSRRYIPVMEGHCDLSGGAKCSPCGGRISVLMRPNAVEIAHIPKAKELVSLTRCSFSIIIHPVAMPSSAFLHTIAGYHIPPKCHPHATVDTEALESTFIAYDATIFGTATFVASYQNLFFIASRQRGLFSGVISYDSSGKFQGKVIEPTAVAKSDNKKDKNFRKWIGNVSVIVAGFRHIALCGDQGGIILMQDMGTSVAVSDRWRMVKQLDGCHLAGIVCGCATTTQGHDVPIDVFYTADSYGCIGVHAINNGLHLKSFTSDPVHTTLTSTLYPSTDRIVSIAVFEQSLYVSYSNGLLYVCNLTTFLEYGMSAGTASSTQLKDHILFQQQVFQEGEHVLTSLALMDSTGLFEYKNEDSLRNDALQYKKSHPYAETPMLAPVDSVPEGHVVLIGGGDAEPRVRVMKLHEELATEFGEGTAAKPRLKRSLIEIGSLEGHHTKGITQISSDAFGRHIVTASAGDHSICVWDGVAYILEMKYMNVNIGCLALGFNAMMLTSFKPPHVQLWKVFDTKEMLVTQGSPATAAQAVVATGAVASAQSPLHPYLMCRRSIHWCREVLESFTASPTGLCGLKHPLQPSSTGSLFVSLILDEYTSDFDDVIERWKCQIVRRNALAGGVLETPAMTVDAAGVDRSSSLWKRRKSPKGGSQTPSPLRRPSRAQKKLEKAVTAHCVGSRGSRDTFLRNGAVVNAPGDEEWTHTNNVLIKEKIGSLRDLRSLCSVAGSLTSPSFSESVSLASPGKFLEKPSMISEKPSILKSHFSDDSQDSWDKDRHSRGKISKIRMHFSDDSEDSDY